jgi:Doubled CXXCH motif (Paired_CXXCH_1)
VKMCLACHDGQSIAPDVFGASGSNNRRMAGGLNAKTGTIANDVGYAETDGHTLYSNLFPPGAGIAPGSSPAAQYTPGPEGLICTNCHAQHGTSNYRNLLNRGLFAGDTLSYAVGTNDLTKDIFERNAKSYVETDMDFNEPNTSVSKYANWCQNCHVDFHGAAGAGTNMGGQSGGVTSANVSPWKRHPTADVNIGTVGATFISSIARFNGLANRVKVMDSQGLWNATAGDNTVTPSCMSCHKGHGNANPFGLIFMTGTGSPTENGDGGVYKDLCRQCHVQGA